MSTNDVPGYKAEHRDVLAAGCWAEAADPDDGSLIYITGLENRVVVYLLFDTSRDPPMSWFGSMPEARFKEEFSWKPEDDDDDDKWVWHDKTPFPWSRVTKDFPEGPLSEAAAVMTAAQRVAERLGLTGRQVQRGEFEHMAPQTRDDPYGEISSLLGKLQDAISRLRP